MSSPKLNLIGFTASAFDLLHAGHIAMLKEAKSQCDYLLVGLQTDPSLDRPDEKNAPVQSMVERYIQLSAISFIDEIIPYRTEKDLVDILKVYPINVRVIGEEYKHEDFTGRQYCIDNNIHIHYNNRQHDFSTSGLRKRILDNT
jgi:glycerol-3-phosphate cytidylyltransferase|tara:strand:+ start:5287 stop:5718 length:432 start_codon:yes stop_codon:yes gene_type:complete